MSARRGLSLLEAVVAMALLALGFLFALSIVPTSVRSVKQAEEMEAASAYALEMVESARMKLPPPGVVSVKHTINRTTFEFRREVVHVGGNLTDVVIEVSWNPRKPPLRFATRLRCGVAAEEER